MDRTWKQGRWGGCWKQGKRHLSPLSSYSENCSPPIFMFFRTIKRIFFPRLPRQNLASAHMTNKAKLLLDRSVWERRGIIFKEQGVAKGHSKLANYMCVTYAYFVATERGKRLDIFEGLNKEINRQNNVEEKKIGHRK